MRVEDSRAIQPFLGMAASLAYILAIDWNPLISPERKRLPGPSKSDPIKNKHHKWYLKVNRKKPHQQQ